MVVKKNIDRANPGRPERIIIMEYSLLGRSNISPVPPTPPGERLRRWCLPINIISQIYRKQPPYNLLNRRIENETLPRCQAYDLGIIAWSPLAQGILAGGYTDASNLPNGSRGAQPKVFRERITQADIEGGKNSSKKPS